MFETKNSNSKTKRYGRRKIVYNENQWKNMETGTRTQKGARKSDGKSCSRFQQRLLGKVALCARSQKEYLKSYVGKSPNSSVANIRLVWTGQ